MWILYNKNNYIVIYNSYTRYILKATKMLLEHIYYIKYILALCYISIGY
jgi:hypothetical protein